MRASPGTVGSLALAMILAGAPALADSARAQARQEASGSQPKGERTERLEELASRVGAVTGHLKQMAKTLRANPELEERWTSPAAFDRMIQVSAMTDALTRQAAALSRQLDALTDGGEATGGSRMLDDQARRIDAALSDLVPALETLGERVHGLTDVAHEGEGRHPHDD